MSKYILIIATGVSFLSLGEAYGMTCDGLEEGNRAKGPGVGRSVSADEDSAERTKATIERELDKRVKAKAIVLKVFGLANGKYGY